MLLLDTCALLWLARGDGPLSPETNTRIAEHPVVCLSAISGFEIGTKYRKGKLRLPAEPTDWLEIIVAHHNLLVLPLDLEICAAATSLPEIHHDPCDRLIIATALAHKLTVVTTDRYFAAYGVSTIS